MESSKKYTVFVGKKVEKFLNTLPEPYFSAITIAMDELENDPRPQGCKKLKGNTSYRIRVGNYRIVYDILDDTLVIIVINIGHRKNVYKDKK